MFTQHHVYVDSSTIHGSTWITTGDGVDLVYLLGRSRFASDVFLGGGQDKHDTLRIDGHGHGHGVGLCQYGARALAEEGMGHAEILRWYYPGVELVTAYT